MHLKNSIEYHAVGTKLITSVGENWKMHIQEMSVLCFGGGKILMVGDTD